MHSRSQASSAATILVLLVAGSAGAHDLATSYARFQISRNALETTFTFDLDSLVRLAPGLDANRDGQITAAELAAQAPAIQAFLRKRVELKIDGKLADFGMALPVEFPPDVGDAIAEQDYHAATSLIHFGFEKPLATPAANFWVNFDYFQDFGNRHIVLGAIAQDGEEYEVVFRYYEPDYRYDTGYTAAPPLGDAAPALLDTDLSSSEAPRPREAAAEQAPSRSNTNTSLWQQLGSFFRLGVEHIFLGYDHILFLVSLIVVCKLCELVKIVTSFTVAHTITLILATLEVVQLPSRAVETAIAATIVYVALENFWIREAPHRWKLTFAFGLIHGFGFAGVLRELGLPKVGLVRSLLAFNVGVEVGQLAIVLALFPLAYAIARLKYGGVVQKIISGAIVVCGLCWFIDRAFGLQIMPF
jgi:hypothetical protein